MIKDVIIDIKTEQTVDGNTDTIQFTTDGRFGKKDGSFFISYDEGSPLKTIEGVINRAISDDHNTEAADLSAPKTECINAFPTKTLKDLGNFPSLFL